MYFVRNWGKTGAGGGKLIWTAMRSFATLPSADSLSSEDMVTMRSIWNLCHWPVLIVSLCLSAGCAAPFGPKKTTAGDAILRTGPAVAGKFRRSAQQRGIGRVAGN